MQSLTKGVSFQHCPFRCCGKGKCERAELPEDFTVKRFSVGINWAFKKKKVQPPPKTEFPLQTLRHAWVSTSPVKKRSGCRVGFWHSPPYSPVYSPCLTSGSSGLKTPFSISCLTPHQAMRSACLASQLFLLLRVSKGWGAGESTLPQRTDIPAHVQQNLGFLGRGEVAQTCDALLFGMCMHIHESHLSSFFF